jgi:nucleotide-binding universal stress UspA family protein
MKFAHLLVPLDESDLAEAALDYAVDLVAPQGKVTLLSVVEPSSFGERDHYDTSALMGNATGVVATSFLALSTTGSEQYAWDNARNYLDRVADRIQSRSFVVERELREGKASECILDVAEAMQVDAIVMSTHGRSGLSRWVMGSVAQKVLSAATCPVFLVPQRSLQPAAS